MIDPPAQTNNRPDMTCGIRTLGVRSIAWATHRLKKDSAPAPQKPSAIMTEISLSRVPKIAMNRAARADMPPRPAITRRRSIRSDRRPAGHCSSSPPAHAAPLAMAAAAVPPPPILKPSK